jgi:glycosyltransferase involved in cell wall biosynthesis
MVTDFKRAPIVQVVADGAAGGGTTFVIGLCEELMARGVSNVTMITRPGSFAYDAALAKSIRVEGFDFFSSRFDLTLGFRLGLVLKAMAPQLVHVHGGRAAHSFTLAPLSRTPYPLVYTVHGYHFQRKALPLRALAQYAERRIAERADHVCFVSRSDRELAYQQRIIAHDHRASVIYNGVEPKSSEQQAKKIYDVTFVGRVVEQKNPFFAIDVFASLRRFDLRFLFIGAGSSLEKVRSYADERGLAGRIEFTGELHQSDVAARLARSRILLFPSLWEGLPITPMEAMRAGVPVVASKIPGTDEVVADGEDGLLVDSYDADTYATEIMRLLNDAALYERISMAAMRAVHEKFSRGRCVQQYIALYQQLLDCNKRSNCA